MSADHVSQNRAEPKAVYKLYDGDGKTPSQIAVELNVSLTEVLDVLERRRKENLGKDTGKVV